MLSHWTHRRHKVMGEDDTPVSWQRGRERYFVDSGGRKEHELNCKIVIKSMAFVYPNPLVNLFKSFFDLNK